MGKVKDGGPASTTANPAKTGASGGMRGRFVQFLANLGRTNLYKPMQGWYARTYTAAGLGLVVVLGLWQLYKGIEDASPAYRFGIPTAIGAALGWVLFRLVQYPPFVEFLIATEAEMNKVSWTSRDDLYRATSVVLTTVLLVSFFLFGVDWVWS